ncbi:sigma-70 family RNA polymerase sigma factor [Abyssalbus ytuae]|uniref:Sigma-70 family RNA polymerase sigma factor n=1 Tax=Abyssalbus ytuae TaxID=2926907 RepID=A0A9E6ZZX4_9FLAO|nr:sigma-70 family RNA polymerase sigma factor [Abyssalbus ytuae]UOB17016.1 sigma-70 family RNA polymerase sigma factor [Abyssalbus ytuae]
MHNKKEFIKAVKDNEGIIFKITTIYSNNKNEQEDLYQEIVYQLWKYFDSFRNESKISTWIYKVALNTSITYLKKEKRNGVKIPIENVVINHIEEKDTIKEERITQLYSSIKKLNTVEKGLILLFLEGKSYEEIAEISGFTPTNVGTRLHRIKLKLKSTMNK